MKYQKSDNISKDSLLHIILRYIELSLSPFIAPSPAPFANPNDILMAKLSPNV